MTALELITLADTLAENPFDQDYKLGLVNRIEQRVCRELTLTSFTPAVISADPVQAAQGEASQDQDTSEREDETDEEVDRTELYLSGPVAEAMYLAWMKAMLYWSMGEYEIYQNEKAMFDHEWAELAAYVCQTEHEGSCGKEYR